MPGTGWLYRRQLGKFIGRTVRGLAAAAARTPIALTFRRTGRTAACVVRREIVAGVIQTPDGALILPMEFALGAVENHSAPSGPAVIIGCVEGTLWSLPGDGSGTPG